MAELNPEHSPPEEFIEEVKQALENLYDIPFLQTHPLALRISEQSGEKPGKASVTAGQRLRTDILQTLEILSPGPGVGFRSPQARLHNLLHLRYVEGLTIRQAASDLGISTRQAYRNLRHAEEKLAALLWTRLSNMEPNLNNLGQMSTLKAEINHLVSETSSVNLFTLVNQSLNAVNPLAAEKRIRIAIRPADETLQIYTNPVIARQVTTSVISHAVQLAETGDFEITLTSKETIASVSLEFKSKENTICLDEAATELLSHLDWTLEEIAGGSGKCKIMLTMPAHRASILVIDDNEGLIDLMKRYISDEAYRVVGLTTGQEGIRYAQDFQPDMIFLDVMMPNMDGWEVLQYLNNHPDTKQIPIVLCTVFNDPALAYSLGASKILPKPINREEVLAAIAELCMK